jgi:alpha-L-rhamnosidase
MIWERLNSYTHTEGFGGNNWMNSFNHYSFGAIAAWMYNYSLGIERDEQRPGFKHFFLKPEVDAKGEMTFAIGHYDSMYGKIESAWTKTSSGYRYAFTVPANTSATLILVASSKYDIKSGKDNLDSIDGVKYVGESDGKQLFTLAAGKYKVDCGK